MSSSVSFDSGPLIQQTQRNATQRQNWLTPPQSTGGGGQPHSTTVFHSTKTTKTLLLRQGRKEPGKKKLDHQKTHGDATTSAANGKNAAVIIVDAVKYYVPVIIFYATNLPNHNYLRLRTVYNLRFPPTRRRQCTVE